MAEQITSTDRVTLRVTPDINNRADALVKRIARDAQAQGYTRVTRATVLKRALMAGLAELEKQYK